MRGCVLALLARRVLATPVVVHANGTRTPLSDRIANEQLCEDASRFPTDPGSTRVAVILRGDAFRGLSYGTTVRHSKLPFYCDGLAHRALDPFVPVLHPIYTCLFERDAVLRATET